MSQPIEGDGTPEHAWLGWQTLRTLPELTPRRRRVLVVAPHPDDEILAAGGLLVELAARGAEISVLALTDGEASHPRAAIDPGVLGPRRADGAGRRSRPCSAAVPSNGSGCRTAGSSAMSRPSARRSAAACARGHGVSRPCGRTDIRITRPPDVPPRSPAPSGAPC